ncbi:uncharacterized protein LOC119981402 [Tripterygium wilfordii]|uniref:uncharacterized protein LOC119981402 n=1 Tax=Tripterygium wilfordii TaxID=458696 RepID=UPI0018F82643|nr:uncharacterized protein LOC119981402 [Tripterygium wilfordii]
MPCSKETLAWLFYNASSSLLLLLLLLFLYFSITFLLKLLHFIGSYPIIQRTQNDFDYIFSEEEEEEEEVEDNNNYFHVESTAESIPFVSNNINHYLHRQYDSCEELPETLHDPVIEELQDGSFGGSDEQFSSANGDDLSPSSESVQDGADVVEQEIPKRYADSLHNFVQNKDCPTLPTSIDHQPKSGFMDNDKNRDDYSDDPKYEKTKVDSNFSEDENFLVYAPTELESKKLKAIVKDDEEIFGDSCTNGSTSKSSSEWRSSINCRDSGTEDPFSSSSRRSCPKWESYTVFQKYDEEMMFLDRISAQKLHETESLRSIKVCPRSVSERIIHKFATINKSRRSDIGRNPYHELESAYVAQICLTWEALNWNYINFQRKRAARRRDFDPGCPAGIAQQFQQFQVLLQRYIENEPYEQGRRPEIYARMRLLAPKLLLVPEYRDYEDDEKDEGFGSRISTASFLMIMEDGIRTFMSFLKADKEKRCQILKAFFSRNRRGSIDPTLLHLTKKVNKKKKMKLKDLRRARNCIRKRRLTVDEEMEILMGLIDLKLVSRVLRMSDLGGEQMHWCEEKMSKVRVSDGKLKRDSSTLFFPSH